jgi:pyrophosphatase PpaX
MSAGSYATCLFDLDGTLIDSIALIRSSYEHALVAHGHDRLSESEWLEGLGRPLAWQFSRRVSEPAAVDALIRTYREHNLAHHDSMVRAYAGALDTLRGLAQRGVRLAVVTSKSKASARRGLALCGFADLFEAVVAQDDCEQHKPAPEPALRALEALGRTAGSALMIGDSPHDLACGRAAGCATAAVGWGPFPESHLRAARPDHWLDRFDDLLELCPPR